MGFLSDHIKTNKKSGNKIKGLEHKPCQETDISRYHTLLTLSFVMVNEEVFLGSSPGVNYGTFLIFVPVISICTLLSSETYRC